MRSISLLGLFALLASLPLATKFQVAFSLVKALVTPGIVFAAGFRAAAVDAEEDAHAPAPKPGPAANRKARIVVNVGPDGKRWDKDGKVLADEGAMVAYLKEERLRIELEGLPAGIYVRAHDDVHFQFVRKAIRAGAKAGIKEVIFVSIKGGPDREREHEAAKPEKDGNEEIDGEDRDLDIKLPEVKPVDDQPAIMPFFIKLDAKGRVYLNTGEAQELVEDVPGVGSPAKLDQRLDLYATAARLAGCVPAVHFYIEDDVNQARVLDVIDVLAKHGIGHLTLVDLIGEE